MLIKNIEPRLKKKQIFNLFSETTELSNADDDALDPEIFC